MSNIAFFHQGLLSFVEKDVQVLKSENQLRIVQFRGLHSVNEVCQSVLWADMTFSWFGKLHAFLAKRNMTQYEC